MTSIKVFSTAKAALNTFKWHGKTRLVPEYLLQTGVLSAQQIVDAPLVQRTDVERVHDAGYVDRFYSKTLTDREIRKTGLVQSDELVQRVLTVTGGTLAAATEALHSGKSANLAGGAHHAHYDWGHGFSIFNDIVVAAESLRAQKKLQHYLVIDLDVHQGDGDASMLTANKNCHHAYILDMYCAQNFPLRKVEPNWAIPLQKGTGDAEYLEKLQEALQELQRRRFHTTLNFDLIIYQAGVDVLDTDKLGHLSLSMEGVAERDRLVMHLARSTGVPICVCMGGGYAESEEGLERVVRAHSQTIEILKSS